ncbi:MAG TPA: flagellar basal body rod protein FlgC [Paucimonas sp.]|nr:flagellar basal body rod protein FlgC [Paucimonas sp.]
MDFTAYQISAAGMRVESQRLEATARNLANMHSAAAPGTQPFRPLRVVAQEVPLTLSRQFGDAFAAAGGGVRLASFEQLNAAPRMEYDQAHPMADERGMVAYPGINHTAEMLNLMQALRSHEANVTAMKAAIAMMKKTLEIGGER